MSDRAKSVGLRERAKRIALVVLMTLAALNVWTGGPLLALWIGSRVQGEGPPSMGAVFTAAASLAAIAAGLLWALSALGAAYDRVSGTTSSVRRHVPWLRSMRGERETDIRRKHGISPIERVVVVTVVLAVLAFEVWFFFFAGSSLPNQ